MSERKDSYFEMRRHFDVIVEEGRRLGFAISGIPELTERQWLGAQMFKKLVGHSMTLAAITPNQRPGELWDYASMCAITRCAVEAFYAFQYLAVADVSTEEWSERRALYDYHGWLRKVEGSQGMGFKTPASLLAHLAEARARVVDSCMRLGRSPKETDARVKKPQAFLVSFSQQGAELGLPKIWVATMTDFLSWYVHSFPSSLHFLAEFRAESEAAYGAVKNLLLVVNGYLGRANDDFVVMFPHLRQGQTDRAPEFAELYWAVMKGLTPVSATGRGA